MVEWRMRERRATDESVAREGSRVVDERQSSVGCASRVLDENCRVADEALLDKGQMEDE